MKKELDKSKASFKLDLIETANADPMLSPADFKLLSAYVAVMAWPSHRTWLAASLAMAKTGLSHGQFWKSRARLLGDNAQKRAYLITARSGGKVATYKLINPWRDAAIEHVDAMTAYHRETERQKKAGKRAASSLQNMEGQEVGLSLHRMEGQQEPCPSRICSSVPPENSSYYPSIITPSKNGVRDEVSRGSPVSVPLFRERSMTDLRCIEPISFVDAATAESDTGEHKATA